jgi:ribose transport system substrate-binding protein
MNRLRFLLSLITKENDYQMEQAAAAKSTAQELGLDLDILYAENDAITQSTQLLKVIQGNPSVRPAAIIVEPLGATAFTKVASAAVSAGMGWAVINREADYGANLRAASRATVFSIGPDQKEVGRIQGRQIAVLLPRGGSVLYIQGPSVSSVSQQRYEGLMEELSASVKLVQLRGKWTEESAYQSVLSWMKLMRAQKVEINAICAQNDAMAMGTKKAIKETADEKARDFWSKIPVTGCDGVPHTGQTWVRSRQLAATVIVPPSAGKAVALMAKALRTQSPVAEHTFTTPESFPPIDSLTKK